MKAFFIFVFSGLLLVMFSCTSELAKNTTWEGDGHLASDSTVKYKYENVIFYANGKMKMTFKTEDESFVLNLKGNYNIDGSEFINFTVYGDDGVYAYTCEGRGTLSYYTGHGSGTIRISGTKFTWDIDKVSDF